MCLFKIINGMKVNEMVWILMFDVMKWNAKKKVHVVYRLTILIIVI